MWPTAIAGETLLSQEARRHFYSEARLSRGLIYISPLLVKGAEVVCGFYVLWLGHDFPSVTTSLATHFSVQHRCARRILPPQCHLQQLPQFSHLDCQGGRPMQEAEESLSWEAYWHLTLEYFRRWVDAEVVGAAGEAV